MNDLTPHPALPRTARSDADGVLVLGGCRVTDLVSKFGTPLYVHDMDTILQGMRACREAMREAGDVQYAGKAYLARWLLQLVAAEGLGLDVCSGVELELALRAGFPSSTIRLHGNNKEVTELQRAVKVGIGAIVVDSLQELHRLRDIAATLRQRAPVLLRLNPGIEAHTHRYLQTGVLDSKFGLPIGSGDAARAVAMALAAHDAIALLGYHAHIGTQILDVAPYRELMRVMLRFAQTMHDQHGYWPAQLSPGGGAGITYIDEAPLSPDVWLETLRAENTATSGQAVPRLSVEPGRAIIGPAGVALYSVGTIKETPGRRTYISVDGGMADNIRPALYQARYAAIPATCLGRPVTRTVTVAGPYCESGDILIHDAEVPELAPGDLIALPAAGAYCLPMSSNYNGALRPAVVTVQDGRARLVQRRQTVEDLATLDV